MTFDFTERLASLKREAAQFASKHFNSDVTERDRTGTFSRDHWHRCAEYGLLGLPVEPRFGGSGMSMVDALAVMEGFGYGCRDNGLAFAVNAQAWSVVDALDRFGSEEQKTQYLAAVVAGRRIGAFAITEAEAGSDCFSLRTTATADEDDFVISGKKELITLAPEADFALVFARTDPAAGSWGISTFIVDRDTPGYQASPVQSKMGLRTTPIGEIVLDGCRVPASNMLGKPGSGASIFNSTQETERGCILASQLGAMERQLEQMVAFAKQRKQFGQPISRFQSVSNRLVEMKMQYEVSRLLIYRTAALMDAGKPTMMESALTNLYLAESFVSSSLDAVRIRGGRGYLTEFELERDLRDAIAAPLYGGTSDMQRELIARLMGL